ncbi:MAG: hypothetical protein IPH42_10765 [Bacteroidetes bacterium]|nr:hypothetical protein [Bacteroidota bacterium]
MAISTGKKSYGGTLNDVGTQILQTADGGFITCGYGINQWKCNRKYRMVRLLDHKNE